MYIQTGVGCLVSFSTWDYLDEDVKHPYLMAALERATVMDGLHGRECAIPRILVDLFERNCIDSWDCVRDGTQPSDYGVPVIVMVFHHFRRGSFTLVGCVDPKLVLTPRDLVIRGERAGASVRLTLRSAGWETSPIRVV